MKLHELQRAFADAIVQNSPDSILSSINGGGSVSPAERLSVYHNNSIGNLTDALSDTFSATRKLVGDGFFRSMVKMFIPEHMPAEADLNRYGAGFPSFIRQYPPAQPLPYLADVAHFEWLWNEAFLAADDTALAPQEIAMISPQQYPSMRFRLRTSARLMHAAYPVDNLWHFCEANGEGDAPDINTGDVFLLLMRPQLEVITLRLSHAEYLLLLWLSRGNTYEVSAGHALQEDATFDLTAFFTKHFELKTFQSLYDMK